MSYTPARVMCSSVLAVNIGTNLDRIAGIWKDASVFQQGTRSDDLLNRYQMRTDSRDWALHMHKGTCTRALLFAALMLSSGAVDYIDNAGRGVFVQLFEWSWDDVAMECEQYLGPNHFAAVQVSPVQEHVQGMSWANRYQPVSYLLESRGGGAQKFAEMVSRCNQANVAVYVDVVVNHMALPPSIGGNATGTGGSSYSSREFPDYSPSEFHHIAETVTINCEVGADVSQRKLLQTCDNFNLPDLNTTQTGVQQTIASYLSKLSVLGVTGLRVDSAKLISAEELLAIINQSQRPAAGWFLDSEVYAVAGDVVMPTEYSFGRVGEFRFPKEIHAHFTTYGALQYLKDLGPAWGMLDSVHAVSFIDNHDLQRYDTDATITHRQFAMYRLATLTMLALGYGYPRIMSSYYFDTADQVPPILPVHDVNVLHCGPNQPWVCEHRMIGAAGLVQWRLAAGNHSMANWQSMQEGNMVTFNRGQAFVAINNAASPFTGSLQTSLPVGTYCNAAAMSDAGECTLLYVDQQGEIKVTIGAIDLIALYSNNSLVFSA